MIAARNSWRCVQARLKDEWINLMSEDVVIEDPIGVGPSNPTGQGFRGKSEAEKFWDLGPGAAESLLIQTDRSHASGSSRTSVVTSSPMPFLRIRGAINSLAFVIACS